MDLELQEAAYKGDVSFLRQAVATKRSEYFLSRAELLGLGNIIHIATFSDKQDFIREVIKSLPVDHINFLFTQEEPSKKLQNPLHFAATKGNLGIIKLILEFYRTLSSKNDVGLKGKPWLARDEDGQTPLHLALFEIGREECALEILSMDMEVVCNIEGKDNVSPLYAAVSQGYNRVAIRILTSARSYSLRGRVPLNPLHFLPECSEEVGMLLLDKHPDLLKDTENQSSTVIHSWAWAGKLWPFESLVKIGSNKTGQHWRSYIVNHLYTTESSGNNNPLHCAASSTVHGGASGGEAIKVMQFLVEAYKQETDNGEIRQEASRSSLEPPLLPPWYMKNGCGKTPLDLAIERNEKLGLYMFSIMDSPQLMEGDDNNPLFLAVELKRWEVVKIILDLMEQNDGWRSFVYHKGRNIFHEAAHYNEDYAPILTLLIEKLPQHINELNTERKTPLKVASENFHADWLVICLLSKEPSLITRAPFSWIEPCKRGYLSIIYAFIEHCPNFGEICRLQKDTPLHHIQLQSSKEYLDFLRIPLIRGMKNVVDFNGATPLHRAIERKDMDYVEALVMTNWVFKNMKDRNGKTALDLLAELCDQDQKWKTFCEQKEIKLPPRTRYIQPQQTHPYSPTSPTRSSWHPISCFKDDKTQTPSRTIFKLYSFNKKNHNQLEEEVVELLRRLKENMTKEEVHDLLVANEAPLSWIVGLVIKMTPFL